MPNPSILLVPTLTELEWTIKPQLERWADVASYDAPGVGDEPGTEMTPEGISKRGLEEIDRRGWKRVVIVADEAGVAQAVRLAALRPAMVAGVALGHAVLSFEHRGDRAPLNAEVLSGLIGIARADYRSYVRALTQVTQHAYDDEFADRYMERVPQDVALVYVEQLLDGASAEDLEPALRSLSAPKLLVEHSGCLLWTREGFEDISSAFPDATTGSLELKPSVNPAFGSLLADFCSTLDW